MAHISAVLPQCISAGSEGLIGSMVDVIGNPSGYDVRVQRRSMMRRTFNPVFSLRRRDGTPDTGTLYDIIRFWEAVEGPLHTFAYHDRLDHKSCSPNNTPAATDCLIGTGTGAQTAFQLRKGYTVGSTTKYRNIYLPKAGTVLAALDGTPTTAFTVNATTGIITFNSAPGSGVEVTAGFWFYCKVRFDMPDLSNIYEGYKVGSAGQMQLIEVIE